MIRSIEDIEPHSSVMIGSWAADEESAALIFLILYLFFVITSDEDEITSLLSSYTTEQRLRDVIHPPKKDSAQLNAKIREICCMRYFTPMIFWVPL